MVYNIHIYLIEKECVCGREREKEMVLSEYPRVATATVGRRVARRRVVRARRDMGINPANAAEFERN